MRAVSNFGLKSVVQKATVTLRRLGDYSLRHPYRAMEDLALQDSVALIREAMPDALGFDTPKELLHYALTRVPASGFLAEFGVNQGGTVRYIAKRMPGRVIHGFDSFAGLPEDWSGNNMQAGFFNRDGRLPRVPKSVVLHPGWFDRTVPAFAATTREPAAFLHIDCDLYSSTRTIFDALGDRIVAGTVIVFDEYFNYPSWQNHEHKAFREFATRHDAGFRYIGYSYHQVAVIIDRMGAPA